jgi:lipid-binding SYLF domain-containing protein
MKTSQLSIGIQVGVVASDMIMMLMTDKAVKQLAEGLSKAACSGGLTLGSIGLSVAGGGGAKGGIEVLIVETSNGLYIGSGVGKLDMDELIDVNTEAYGKGYGVHAILGASGGQLESA